MKTTLRMSLLSLLLCSTGTIAETPDAARHLNKLNKALNLDAQQQQQVEDILQQQQKQREALFAEYNIDQRFHDQMRAIRKDGATKVAAVLNEEQRQKFQSMRKQSRGKYNASEG